jgi:hypothetical protein
MKSILIYLLISFFSTYTCTAQETSPAKLFYYEPLLWRIVIPAGFSSVPQSKLDAMGKEGRDMLAINDSLSQKIDHGFLFAVSSDEFHYMDAKVVHIPNGSSKELFSSWEKGLRDGLQSMKAGLPTAKFDTLSYQELVTGIVFYAHKLQMHLDENQQVTQYSFPAIIGNRAMAVNIVAMNPEKEKLLLSAFRTSTFGPKKGTYAN